MNTRYVRPSKLENPGFLLCDLLQLIQQYRRQEKNEKIIAQSLPIIDPSSAPSIAAEVICLSQCIAKLTLDQLDKVIDRWEACDLSKSVTNDEMALIQSVFDDHFKRIKNSPMDYAAVSASASVNNLLCQIAKGIDRSTQGKTPWLKLLISSLTDEVARQYSTNGFRFKNAVISQDGLSIIPIGLIKNSDTFSRLSLENQERVLSHSPQAKTFYLAKSKSQSGEFRRTASVPTAISRPLSMVDDQALSKSDGELYLGVDGRFLSHEQSRSIDLDLALLDSSDPAMVVDTASLISLRDNLFLDRRDLCQFVSTHFDRKSWPKLIDTFGEQVLDKLFLQASAQKNTPVLAIKADDHHAVMWFFVNALYKKKRETQPEYTSCMPAFFHTPASSKTAKLAGVSLIMGLITQGLSFDAIHAELMKAENAISYQSLSNGDLGKMNAPFMVCANNEYTLVNKSKTLTP